VVLVVYKSACLTIILVDKRLAVKTRLWKQLIFMKEATLTLDSLYQVWSAPLRVDSDQAAVLPVCRMC